MQTQHVPVMLNEVLKFLHPKPGGHYVDGTSGGGGHTEALLEYSAPDGRVLSIDADTKALARVRERLAEQMQEGRLVLAHGNFSDLARIAREAGFVAVQGVLLDLGFSSDQMNDPQRGFSFSSDGPLDMRLDQTQGISATELVNSASEQELADIIWRYGEENRSRQIARRIVQARAKQPITRTAQLAQLAASGVRYKAGAIHPATRTFQALRIAVNHELEALEMALPQLLEVLSGGGNHENERGEGESESKREGGTMVIIAFHSLEDRLVKEFMRREARDCICPPHTPVCICGHKARLRILTPKPVIPGEEEIEANPRARSAKLRAAEMIVGS
jgi:16S rRNA (cytosine1402-N4)-methyltransferase